MHPLVEKVLDDRAAMGRGEVNVDWGMGEHLAYASLVASGYAVRLSGEDVGPRHLHAPPRRAARPEPREAGTPAPTSRCRTSPRTRRRSSCIDSVLSEEAVLGFEYGYATAEPEHAGDLGSAVRRLRQRRAGRDRPVHRLGRSEVGPRQRPHADAAARLRRAGPGALLGAPRALPAAVAPTHNMQVVQPTTASADLPPAAPPDDAPVPQAAGHHDAEVAAAEQGRDLAAVRAHQGRVPDRDPARSTTRSRPTRSSA